MYKLKDRRKSYNGGRVRRDLNDLIRSPNGNISEAKLCSVAGKASLLYLLLAYPEMIIKNWEVLMVFSLFLIAPDLIKKLLEMRYGSITGKKNV